ncbi:glutathione S-transferase [Proteobacteria bacterium 005FR1]|nr:glutathione S-transferase [Proteobacteria bacterium 005FR1]
MITLYRFPYSCYALKVQYLLAYLDLPHRIQDVPFMDRSELVSLSGKVLVPVIEHEGTVVTESRDICEHLLTLRENTLVPVGLEAAAWAYLDWSDQTLEHELFRIASPNIARRFARADETAMFKFIKERKFGSGCVEQWEREQGQMVATARRLLEPTLRSLEHNGHVICDRITLADFSLAGHLAMVEYADPALLDEIDPRLLPFLNSVREARCD